MAARDDHRRGLHRQSRRRESGHRPLRFRQSTSAPLLAMGPTGGLEMAAHREVPRETARQITQSQALFREVNERINEIAGNFGLAEGFSIFCECGSSECQDRIELTQTEYERLRRMPTHFAVLRGHDLPAVETAEHGEVGRHAAQALVLRLS